MNVLWAIEQLWLLSNRLRGKISHFISCSLFHSGSTVWTGAVTRVSPANPAIVCLNSVEIETRRPLNLLIGNDFSISAHPHFKFIRNLNAYERITTQKWGVERIEGFLLLGIVTQLPSAWKISRLEICRA